MQRYPLSALAIIGGLKKRKIDITCSSATLVIKLMHSHFTVLPF